MCHHVGLVQADPDLVVMGPDRLDRVLELVRDVELVGVEQQDDAVSTLRKPAKIPCIIELETNICDDFTITENAMVSIRDGFV